MKLHVEREPAAWDLVFQLAEPGDPTDNMTKHWPDSRKKITAGRLVVDRVHEDQDLVERSMFDPTKVPPGIETSDRPGAALPLGVLHRVPEAPPGGDQARG